MHYDKKLGFQEFFHHCSQLDDDHNWGYHWVNI